MKQNVMTRKRKKHVTGWIGCLMILLALSSNARAGDKDQKDFSTMEIQQEKALRGTVVDDKGETLIGAVINVPETNKSTITDTDGNFTLSVSSDAKVFMVSYIGYVSQEIKITQTGHYRIILKGDDKILDEVVVVGYGTTTKRENTGAVTSIKGEDLVKMKGLTIDAMLQGAGTGLQVSQSGGSPGAPVRVMVRGTSSLFSETEPLWVIDGVIIENPVGGFNGSNPLAMINPNDIESFEVLKDAAATAIYGSRGSNGVILVTTKTGKKGEGRINIDYSFGVSELTRTYDDIGFMSSQNWIDQINFSRTNAGMAKMTDGDLRKLPLFSNLPSTVDFTHTMVANTDWSDRIVRTGNYHDINLSTSQGFDKGDIYFSAKYRKEKGVLKNNDYSLFSFRTNVNYTPLNNLTLGVKITGGYNTYDNVPNGGAPSGNTNFASGGFSSLGADALPIAPVYDDKGNYFNILSGYNLAANIDRKNYKDYRENYKFMGVAYADYKIAPVEGLSLRGEVSADINHGLNNFYVSNNLRPANVNYVQTNPITRRNFGANFLINYNRKFGDLHSINVVLGAEQQRITGRAFNLFGENNLGLNMDFGAPTIVSRYPSAGFGAGERYLLSYFGRANYMYAGKYMVGGSFRRDGSSIFRSDKRWSNFAAGSAGWIISEENFMKEQKIINLLKLRASFGQTGNQNIPESATYMTKLDWPGYGELGKTVNVSKLGSKDLTWETTNAFDVGVDFAFLNNRINGSAGYYLQDVKDLLFDVPVPISTGLFNSPSVWANVGDMRNRGFEFNVNATVVNIKDFKWSLGFNITTNTNKVLKLTEALDEKSGLMQGLTYNRKGGRLAAFYLADYAGVDKQTGIPLIYEIDREYFSETGETIKTGNIIPATENNIKNHKYLHKDKTALPTFFGGFSTNLTYKDFELSCLFTYQGGNYIYWETEWNNLSAGNGSRVLRNDIINNTWTSSNTGAKYPVLMWNNRSNINDAGIAQVNADGTPKNDYAYSLGNTTAPLYKGDFIRLRSLQLAYNIPQKLLQKIRVKGLRVYISSNNLFTITNYKGWDPEAAQIKESSVSRNLEQGVYGNVLPNTRVWNIGASLTF